MKRFIILLLPILFVLRVNAQFSPKGISVNEKAPNFTAKDQNCKKIILSSELKKGPVVVPAVYISDRNGKIVFRHFDPDYKQRVSVREI